MFPYIEHKKADLKQILRQRNLRTTGTKAPLASRLVAYDHKHPFRFLDLPREIRNEIYKHAASTRPLEPQKPKRRTTTNLPPRALSSAEQRSLERENRASIQPPALFVTCSQIYTESRLLFYQHHAFRLHLWHADQSGWMKLAKRLRLHQQSTCLERVRGWVDAIGSEARTRIRELEIVLHLFDLLAMGDYVSFIYDLFARFPNSVTVEFRPLWRSLDR